MTAIFFRCRGNKRLHTGFCLLLFCLCFMHATANAEYVFKRDGAIIEGKIIAESAATITLVDAGRNSLVINRSDIMRLLYTKIYLGKMHVRLTTGEVFEAFLVGEDQENFTFRKELHKPEEFVIPRGKVLFTARKNPNELAGTADLSFIKITWAAPFGKSSGYRVYVKQPGEKYELAGKTSLLHYTIDGLKSNTLYYVIVTSIDENGDESLPSNEIQVKTMNRLPGAPAAPLLAGKPVVDERKNISVVVGWTPSKDPDGFIRAYNLFLKGGADRDWRPLGSPCPGTDSPCLVARYQLNGLSDETTYTFKIVAVDNSGAESPASVFSFDTTNVPPARPGNVSFKRTFSKDKQTYDVTATWKESTDSDGEVRLYRVYRQSLKGTELLGEVKKCEYTARGLKITDGNVLVVRALDNRDGVSAGRSVHTGLYRGMVLTVSGGYLLPLGDFKSIVREGYGGMLQFDYAFFLNKKGLKDLYFGLALGVDYFTGASRLYEGLYLVPGLVTMKYRLRPVSWFAIVPTIGAGGAFQLFKFIDTTSEGEKRRTQLGFAPMLTAGLHLSFDFHYAVGITLGADYGILPVPRIKQLLGCTGGLVYKF